MKKQHIFALTTGVATLAACALASCGGPSKPNSPHEKVRYAFNGVENSLKNKSSSKKNAYSNGAKRSLKNPTSNDINTIFNAMSVEKETSNPSFDYDEPPFIQFQYMKALYEEVGDDFAFDTKYVYNIQGEVYYDFSSRAVVEEEAYLQHYSFDLSLRIGIDQNDLITASVGFDLIYTHGDITRHQNKYCELYLDYDMDESSPTYTLTMVDFDDLLDYPSDDEKYISAEYDYVNVEKNQIKEWRKFGICSKQDLASWQSSAYPYKYSVLRGYKDNKVYRIENVFNKNAELKNAVIGGLGFPEALSSRETFKNAPSTQNAKIQTVANKFSQILGKDIVYGFVYTGATEKWERDGGDYENLYLRVIPSDDFGTEAIILEDCSLLSLFDPNGNVFSSGKGGKGGYLSVYLKNGEQDDVAIYNDFNELDVRVRSLAYEKTEWIDVESGHGGDLFSSFVEASGFRKESYEENGYVEIPLEFDMCLKSNPSIKLQENLVVSLNNDEVLRALLSDWSLMMRYIDSYTPVQGAIPEFSHISDILFPSAILEADGTRGRIGFESKANIENEVAQYKNKLKEQGFAEISNNEIFQKRLDDSTVLSLTVMNQGMEFEFKSSQKQEMTIQEVIEDLIQNDDISVPAFDGDYEYSIDEKQTNVIRIEGASNEEIDAYIDSLSDYGFEIGTIYEGHFGIRYDEGIFLRIRAMGRSIAVERCRGTLSVAGDINQWSADDPDYDFKTLSVSESGIVSLSIDVSFAPQQAFKITKNHSWADGGYGMNLFAGSLTHMGKEEKFIGGDNDNIVVMDGGEYTLSMQVSLVMYSPDILMNNFDPYMLDIFDKAGE